MSSAATTRHLVRAFHPQRPLGSVEAKIFTGSFTADASGTQDVFSWLYEGTDHSGGNSGSQVNALQVRLVPEPTTIAFVAGTLSLLVLRRRRQ